MCAHIYRVEVRALKKKPGLKKRWIVRGMLLLLVCLGLKTVPQNSGITRILAKLLTERIVETALPLFGQGSLEREVGGDLRLQEMFAAEFPLMVQAVSAAGDAEPEKAAWVEVTKEAAEGPETESQTEEEILAAMLAENGAGESAHGDELSEPVLPEEVLEITATDLLEENRGFQKNVKTNSFDYEALADYQTLVSTFYTIDAGTTAGSNELNLEKLLSKDVTVSKEDEAPQILIYHTHSLEGFIDSRPGERSDTIVGVGDRLAEILTKEYGYGVLHHTEEYDTTRDDAYANSLPGITKVLEENPGIQVVIDLHRDAGVKGVRRAIDLNGKPTATFMLFNGLSRTRKTGNIEYLYNPYLEDNLSFSFQMQVKAGEYYPGLTRKIYLKAYRYNMHLKPLTLLIELGDSNNTVEEAMNTCDPLAHILDMVLSGEG